MDKLYVRVPSTRQRWQARLTWPESF